MSTPEHLDNLLDRWEELAARGQSTVLEEICQDSPDLLPELEKRIAALKAINRVLKTDDSTVDWTRFKGAQRKSRFPELPGYQILEEMPGGGMGVVYKARQLKLNRIVALKLVRYKYDDNSVQRFREEANILASLQNQHIVQIFDVGEENGDLFFSMEFMEGGTLARKLRDKQYDPDDSARMISTLARTIEVAHQKEIIHRDIKPSNILLTRDGTPKIADFGLAKHLDQESSLTRSGEVMGTPGYMAPEQAAGKNKELGPPTDVYALGATLYEMLAHCPPFSGDTALTQVATETPIPPSRLQPKTPKPLETICLHCLEKQPYRRYDSAQELADDLDRYLRGEPIKARPPTRLEKAWRFLQKRKWVAAALLLMVFAVTAFAVNKMLEPVPEKDQMLRALERGEPVNLLDKNGKPRWHNWRGGSGAIAGEPKNGILTIQSVDFPFLELLPHMPTESFRFKAMIRHEDCPPGDHRVGIFFGLTRLPDPKDEYLGCWSFSFNEVHPAPNDPKGNPLSYLYLYRAWSEELQVKTGKLGGSLLFFPPRFKQFNENPWRSLKVEVNPETIAVFWEDQPGIVRSMKDNRNSYKKQLTRTFPGLDATYLDSSLHGSLGVFLFHGVASFKELVIEPM